MPDNKEKQDLEISVLEKVARLARNRTTLISKIYQVERIEGNLLICLMLFGHLQDIMSQELTQENEFLEMMQSGQEFLFVIEGKDLQNPDKAELPILISFDGTFKSVPLSGLLEVVEANKEVFAKTDFAKMLEDQ